MANCKKCGKPVVTAPVYCPECQEGDDVVQVVWCKNCRHYNRNQLSCMFWPDEGFRSPYHYCAEGERRVDHAAQKEKPHAGTD